MTHEIELSGRTVNVDVARDQEKRYVGLSEKEDLGPDEGMLFVWPTEKEHRLVMRDMNFGVDMVFADASGKVTKVHSAAPDDEDGATAFSKYAVELPRGWTKKAGVEKGDTLDVNESGFRKSDSPTDRLDTLKGEIADAFFERADMDVGMFAALADETPDPEREEVDAPYNEVEGETPDGDTEMAKAIRRATSRVFKVRNFVNSPFAGDAQVEGNQLTFTPPFSKEKAKYHAPEDEQYDEGHENCRSCAFYVDGGGCVMVQGEISPDAYCENLYSDVAISGHGHIEEGDAEEEVTVWGDSYEWDESLIEDFIQGVQEILVEGEGLGKATVGKQAVEPGGGDGGGGGSGGGNEDSWVPYVGPKGGEGWQHASTGEVRYQQDPPGQVHSDFSEDYWDEHDAQGGEEEQRELPDEGVERRDEGYFVSAQPNPERDVESFQEDELASELIETTNSEPMEGFSVHRNLDTYDATQDDAWIVGMTSVELPAEEGISKDDVADFYNEYLEVLEQTPALRIGGYHFENGEKISIDLSVALTDRDEAEQLGQELNQESIFNPAVALGEGDWENGSVMTDGDGDSPLETPEDVLETISNVETLAKSVLSALRAAVNSTMSKQDGLDPDERFENDEGRTLTRMQIFRYGWKEGADIESVEDGYMVNGEHYRSVNNGDE